MKYRRATGSEAYDSSNVSSHKAGRVLTLKQPGTVYCTNVFSQPFSSQRQQQRTNDETPAKRLKLDDD